MAVSAKIPPRLRDYKLGPWTGINERLAPSAIPKDKLANAQNLLLDEQPGTALTRQGLRLLSTLPSGNPPRDVAVFAKLDGTIYLLASDGVKLYHTVDPSLQSAWTLLKDLLNTSGFMEFEVAEDKAWMMNGIDAPMSWDGTTLIVYDRERTVTADNVSITATTVRNAQLTEADDHWNNRKLVFTTGANQGTVVTVTDFDAATDTITFTPSISGGAVTDRFKVGLIIPTARVPRFWDGHLWVFSTSDNTSEGRFHRLTDPNTGADITIDHPLAWPATQQLDFSASDGDRVWAVSPILRDRILVGKATGVFRIERDPLTLYRPEMVVREIGSRFHRSWREKNGLLYFVGQALDGLPDVYKTDMVTVEPVDPDGGLEPTLRNLQQPNAVQKSRIISSQADFDLGTASVNIASGYGGRRTTIKTSNGKIEIGGIDSLDDFKNNLGPELGADPLTNEGSLTIQGIPAWEVSYKADALPQSSSPVWSKVQAASPSESVSGGVLTLSHSGTLGTESIRYKRDNVLNSGQDAWMTVRARTDGQNHCFLIFGLKNGLKQAMVQIANSNGDKTFVNGTDIGVSTDSANFHIYQLLLKAGGRWKLWRDGVKLSEGDAANASADIYDSSLNKVDFGLEFSAVSRSVFFDFVYYHSNFKGDSLPAGYALSMPNTLPASVIRDFTLDYGRAPDALRRIFVTSVLNGGTVGIKSWSSDTEDFSSGNDPAGYVDVANGAAPTSQVKRYQRIRLTLTRADTANGPEVQSIKTGILWLSPAIFIGSNIKAWRTLIAILSTPVGTDNTIKIRRATVLTTPAEGDFGAFAAIVNGDNIGTILADGSPPTSRWVQLKVEQGPDSAGAIPDLDSLETQWTEGSAQILPLHAVTHKKRYMFNAAQRTSVSNDRVIVSDRNDGWMKYVGWNLNAMLHYKGQLLGFSAADSKIFELDVTGHYNDNGAAIDAFMETREETFGSEELRKDLRFSYVHVGPAAGSLELSFKKPADSAYGNLKTLTLLGNAESVRYNFPFATVGRRLQRKYRNAVVDQKMDVRGEDVYFSLRGAQGA